MGGETENGAWIGSFWPRSRKIASDEKEAIGILAFEVAGLMSKVVNLWHSLSDREIMNLKEWITNSVGVKMLVSDDDHHLMELALDEILNSFACIARNVARLGKRCKDPAYRRYEKFVQDPSKHRVRWSGWEYAWKKMDKKVKKMERFVAAMSQLSQELEVLEEREQTLMRMKANLKSRKGKLHEFEKKVNWHKQEVKNLRDMSPWNRTYDYIVRLLARSLFTILERIILVFGNAQQQYDDSPQKSTNYPVLCRTYSVSAHTRSYVHPTDTNPYGLCSEPVTMRLVYSEFEAGKNELKKRHQHIRHRHSESKQLRQIGCIPPPPPNGGSMRLVDYHHKTIDNMEKVDKSLVSYKSRIYFKLSKKDRLNPAPLTLGDAALALHYAEVILLMESIVSSPHFIDPQTRDNLYSKLPTTIRTALRAKLKWYAKTKSDAKLAAEWSMVLKQILEWLAPLAHNMKRWHSERNFEKEHAASRGSVLLVQTLYFANQAKTEAAMVELLVGLNYVCRANREAGVREVPEYSGFG